MGRRRTTNKEEKEGCGAGEEQEEKAMEDKKWSFNDGVIHVIKYSREIPFFPYLHVQIALDQAEYEMLPSNWPEVSPALLCPGTGTLFFFLTVLGTSPQKCFHMTGGHLAFNRLPPTSSCLLSPLDKKANQAL